MRVAALIVGNEILGGKYQEANVVPLATMLRELGGRLVRVVVCEDDLDTIAAEVRSLADSHDFVVTSGGVGPTHDDLTVPGVARAFDVRLVRHPRLLARIEAHFAERTTDAHRRMAELPEGGELEAVHSEDWPLIRMRNVFVMPGVPSIFARRLAVLRAALPVGRPQRTSSLFLRADEGALALVMARIEAEFGCAVGSYPRFGEDEDHSLRVTLDHEDVGLLGRAMDALVASVEPGWIVRIERASSQS